MSSTAIATVTLDLEEGKKDVKMVFKPGYDIEECQEGKAVILHVGNGHEEYSGYYKGMDGDTVMLASFQSGKRIGLELDWISNYWEELTEEQFQELTATL